MPSLSYTHAHRPRAARGRTLGRLRHAARHLPSNIAEPLKRCKKFEIGARYVGELRSGGVRSTCVFSGARERGGEGWRQLGRADTPPDFSCPRPPTRVQARPRSLDLEIPLLASCAQAALLQRRAESVSGRGTHRSCRDIDGGPREVARTAPARERLCGRHRAARGGAVVGVQVNPVGVPETAVRTCPGDHAALRARHRARNAWSWRLDRLRAPSRPPPPREPGERRVSGTGVPAPLLASPAPPSRRLPAPRVFMTLISDETIVAHAKAPLSVAEAIAGYTLRQKLRSGLFDAANSSLWRAASFLHL